MANTWAEDQVIEEAWEAAGNGYLDDQIGSVDEMGWYGRYGAVIIWQDSQGFKDAAVYDTEDEALEAWSTVEEDYIYENE